MTRSRPNASDDEAVRPQPLTMLSSIVVTFGPMVKTPRLVSLEIWTRSVREPLESSESASFLVAKKKFELSDRIRRVEGPFYSQKLFSNSKRGMK